MEGRDFWRAVDVRIGYNHPNSGAIMSADFSKPCYSVSVDVSTMAPGKYGYREARTKYHGCVWADDHAQALAQAIEQFGPGEYVIETAAEQQERREARAARANFTLDDLLAQDWTPALMPEGAREFPVFIEGVHKFDVRAVSLEAAREHVAQFYTAVHEVRPIAELKVEAKAAA